MSLPRLAVLFIVRRRIKASARNYRVDDIGVIWRRFRVWPALEHAR